MTDYNDGKWHGWNGGECPVHPKSEVGVIDVGWSGGMMQRRQFITLAAAVDWSDNDAPVVAFRVVKEYKAPREFWLFQNDYGVLCASEVWRQSGIHVREVLKGEESHDRY